MESDRKLNKSEREEQKKEQKIAPIRLSDMQRKSNAGQRLEEVVPVMPSDELFGSNVDSV